ncbi:hypothetical protein KSP40_PGU008468 [Platanthera guangdongensis]|uniref:Uncharacterized protein n=1 Tax=Platanthera guangdongensis TaxID=2320717 RepID=A0ABR2MX52_9ASPA
MILGAMPSILTMDAFIQEEMTLQKSFRRKKEEAEVTGRAWILNISIKSCSMTQMCHNILSRTEISSLRLGREGRRNLEFKVRVEGRFSLRIKKLSTDNDGEFTSHVIVIVIYD